MISWRARLLKERSQFELDISNSNSKEAASSKWGRGIMGRNNTVHKKGQCCESGPGCIRIFFLDPDFLPDSHHWKGFLRILRQNNNYYCTNNTWYRYQYKKELNVSPPTFCCRRHRYSLRGGSWWTGGWSSPPAPAGVQHAAAPSPNRFHAAQTPTEKRERRINFSFD